MRYKENQKKIFDEKFLELNMKTVTPDDLMNALEDGKVIIAVKSFEENTCEVRSYAVMNDEMVVCGCKRCANNIPPITYVTYVASVPYVSNYAQNSPQGLKNPERCSMLVDVRTSSQECQNASKT